MITNKKHAILSIKDNLFLDTFEPKISFENNRNTIKP